ncbi:hypothetical protein VU10_05470 [Desulfobulbus sp. US1]|nr:hypothetical protein [Desulfobulbus sp. US4]MCW5204703.1 hypothetical protein [Desulfobulbus sp. N2]MCW5207165.1 hypothetical protein [Desulfobulbus sp. US2]MCW5209619.1 hypothetical protein [Desulfobulbus sp. US1]MCW5213834.1 hypothetical protein [Desulfobulbus sp. US5]
MSNLIWLVFIFLVVVLVISVLWFIWRLRHFSQSHNQTVLDDKLMQSMLGDEALSKELKTVLVGKASGVKYPTETEEEAGPDSSDAGQQSSKEEDMKREGKI